MQRGTKGFVDAVMDKGSSLINSFLLVDPKIDASEFHLAGTNRYAERIHSFLKQSWQNVSPDLVVRRLRWQIAPEWNRGELKHMPT